MADSSVSIRIMDYSRETSSLGFRVPDLSVAGNMAALGGLFTDFLIALQGVSSGAQLGSTIVYNRTRVNASAPTDPTSQRENKWLVRYQDTTNQKYGSFEVPCAILNSNTLPQHSDFADLTHAPWPAFVTAAEALVRSSDGNSISIKTAQFVGRKG